MVDKVKPSNPFAQNQQKAEVTNKPDTYSNSIFDRMDKYPDGQVTKSEANAFGFTTLGDKPLTRIQFEEMFRAFREKTSTLYGTMENFEDILHSVDLKDCMDEIQLTEKQRKELLFRIEMAKAYNNTFNKKTTLNDLESVYNKLLQGKAITKGSLMDILRWAKFDTDNISDGKISTFNQGSVGDCYFLSLLNSYVSTPEGEQNIKERIKQNADGSYTVTFNNPFDQNKKEFYTVTADEINKYKSRVNAKHGAGGDIDVNILELAANKMLEKYLPKGLVEGGSMAIQGSDSIKQLLIHKAFGYTDSPKHIRTKEDGTIEECSYEFELDTDGKIKMPNMNSIKRKTLSYSSLIDLIKKRNYKMNELTIGKAGDQNSTGHEYNLVGITEKDVIVNDPHYTQFSLSIPKGELEKNGFISINYYPQSRRIL